MSARATARTAWRWGWTACFILVFVSAFVPSGTRQSVLELDPSWHAVIEYATAHHWQFGTQIVFTFGPLGFLSTRTSLGHLIAARIAFAFFWSTLIALAATGMAKRLPAWVRYPFLAWLLVFTLSEGIDQTAFFVMACGAIFLLIDDPHQRWQTPLFVLAFIVLALIKITFLAAALASLALVVVCRMAERKIVAAILLSVIAPAAFVAAWVALGQSPAHLGPWFRHALELTSGYSAAMNLTPKSAVLWVAVGALALFACAFVATALRIQRGIVSWGIVITIAQYAFFAWKEGFTRSGDWHAFVFLWFLPLGVAFCLLPELANPHATSQRWVVNAAFAASIVLCMVAANLQISGFAWRQIADWPRRVSRNAATMFASASGRADDLYADCRNSRESRMLTLDRAKDVIGGESVDVMNYLALAPIVNGMSYRPRPIFQGFVAYTPALQNLNLQYFESADRPHFILLSQEATDGRFPSLEDSAALNYVLNNYAPVARDGRFLLLQQRTAESLQFKLVARQTLHFGETLDLRPWAPQPLFMTVGIDSTWLGRLAALLYQQHPLRMRVANGRGDREFRLVPSMARRPFLITPLLGNNYQVLSLLVRGAGTELDRVTFERPSTGAFEFRNQLSVCLYTAPDFPRAAREVPASRLLADVQGRIFWPEPSSVQSAGPAQVMMLRGAPALLLRAPSKIVVQIPEQASAFIGYWGAPAGAFAGIAQAPEVTVSIAITDRSGRTGEALKRTLRPSHPEDDRIAFRVPVDGARDRTITLTTRPVASGGWSIWSQCRIDESPQQ